MKHRQTWFISISSGLIIGIAALVLNGCSSGGKGGGSTPPSGADPSALNAEGLEFLKSGATILDAKGKFQEAAAAAGTQSSNEADTARFFYALTRVAALGFDLVSDGNPNDLNRAADILDRLGCSSGGRDPLNWTVTCPSSFPNNSPTGVELQTFLKNVVLPELEGATNNLDGISNSFNRSWVEPASGTTVESDYGDVLFYRAGLKGLRANILILLSYNVDVDIDAEANDTTSDTQTRLARNPNLLKPTAAASTDLPQARTLLQGAADDLNAAVDAIQAETDSQADDLVNLDNTTSAEIAQAKTSLTTYKNALSAQTTVSDHGTPAPGDDVIVNGDPFFAANPPIDLRAKVPPYTTNISGPGTADIPGMFPDPTFDGVLIQPNVNEDLNSDGTPDVLEIGEDSIVWKWVCWHFWSHECHI